MSYILNPIFSTSLLQYDLQSKYRSSLHILLDNRKLTTSTLLQCICSLIPEVLVRLILQTLSTAVGRVLGKLYQEEHTKSSNVGVLLKEIVIPPALFPFES